MEEKNNLKQAAEETASFSPLIVGIGASAGGLEALQQFFQHMPSNSGLSFVVIQHLSPDYKSLMADILAKHTELRKHTEMRVTQAETGMAVEPDTVYLIPPKKNMTIRDGKLILSEFVQGMLNHPIDVFFTSLAKEQKEHAVVVVLSGTGTDGTGGVKAVKEKGGLVIVQSPETAKFDGMPRSAINTGLADFVLSPEEIVDEIGELITGVVAEEDSAEPSVSTVEEDVASLDEASGKEVTSDIAEESAEPVTPPSDEGTPLSEGSQNALPPVLPQESILDNRLSDDIMYLMIELIVVVFIFTITSAIRSRFQRPLPVFISLILTALFIAIPITASMIISGWRNFHYVYFVLAICFIVLRSKDKRG